MARAINDDLKFALAIELCLWVTEQCHHSNCHHCVVLQSHTPTLAGEGLVELGMLSWCSLAQEILGLIIEI